MLVKIKIYLDGKKLVAERSWPQVPRSGDVIKLHGALSGAYKVLPEIVWAGDDDNPQALIDVEAI